MSDPKNLLDEYLKTAKRLEPEVTMLDAGYAYASACISLKRIADSLEYMVGAIKEEREKDEKK